MMANVQMGAFNLGTNGILLSKTPPSCYLSTISLGSCWNFDGGKPKLSRVGSTLVWSNSIWVKRNWSFDGSREKPQFGVVGGLGSGEVGTQARSTSVQLIEDEVKFSPAFGDYLKVMESVRMDRSKNVDEGVEDARLRKRSVGKDGEKGGSRGGKVSYREKGRESKSRSRWRLVKSALEKKMLGMKSSARNTMYDEQHMKERRSLNVQKERNVGEVRMSDESRNRGPPKDALKSRSGHQLNDIKRVENVFEDYSKKVNYENDGRGKMGENEMKQSGGKQWQESKVERKTVETENGSGHSLNYIKRVENDIEKNYGKKVHHFNDGRGMMGGNEMKQRGGKQLRKSKMETKIVETVNGKGIANNMTLNETLTPHSSYGSSSFTQTSTSKKSEQEETILISEERKIEGKLNGNEVEIQRKTLNRRLVRSHEVNRKLEKVDSRAIEMLGRSTKEHIELDNGIDVEDRAAFKTFEVFTDVRNRPRVLRMEMEERIQNLAKRLNSTDVNMPEWQFSKILHGAGIKFTEHSILRVVQILGKLGNWRRALQVVQWLQSRERFKSYKSRYIYTAVLDVLGKSKRHIESLNIFYDMRKELQSFPDLAAYHCIAVTLGQAGLMKELLDVIDCMRALPEKNFKLGPLKKWDPRLEPDLVVYNAVLNACVQQKQWEGAFWVLQQLKQQNIRPTNTTYGLIMEVMLVSGKYNLVHEFFRKVQKTSTPSVLNYKVLVNTLWREGKIDEAVMAVKEMERRGVVGSASLYYDLARCLCSAGRCQEALLQIDKICKVANKPLVVTYTGLIQACINAGSMENATFIFNEMHKFCSPNTVTCNIMLMSYLKHGMFGEAKDLFQKILDGNHHLKSKNDTDRRAFYDKFTFNTMMEACAEMNNWDDFVYVYEEMLLRGFYFDARRHLRLVLDAFRAGKKHVIETTWAHMIGFGRSPPPPIIQERFCIKLQENDHLVAVSCIQAYQGKDMYPFTEKAWLNLLKRNSDCFRGDTILRLTQELRNLIDEKSCTHRPIFKNLLNACKELAEATNAELLLTKKR